MEATTDNLDLSEAFKAIFKEFFDTLRASPTTLSLVVDLCARPQDEALVAAVPSRYDPLPSPEQKAADFVMKKNDLAELGQRLSVLVADPLAFLSARLQNSLANDDPILSESSASSIAKACIKFIVDLNAKEDASASSKPIFLSSGRFPVSRKTFDACFVAVTAKSVALLCFAEDD